MSLFDIPLPFLLSAPRPVSDLFSIFVALATLVLVIPTGGLLWFWFVRSQD